MGIAMAEVTASTDKQPPERKFSDHYLRCKKHFDLILQRREDKKIMEMGEYFNPYEYEY